LVFILPENRLNSKFVHFVDQDHQIVAEPFAQRLVDHRYVCLAPDQIPELPLNHTEGGFGVTSFVVVVQEVLATEREIMEHLLE